MPKPAAVQCRGLRADGGRCELHTCSASGLCQNHVGQAPAQAPTAPPPPPPPATVVGQARLCRGKTAKGEACQRTTCDASGLCYQHQQQKQEQQKSASQAAPGPVRPQSRTPAQTPAERQQPPVAGPSRAATEPGCMTRAAYRSYLIQCRLPLAPDQDVFHIISSENGGADHVRNYHFAQGQSWNRAIGANHDAINCFMAGKERAREAVEVSRRLGNSRGVKYAGPSADQLYKEGEEAMRTVRLDNRNRRQQERAFGNGGRA